MDIDPSSPPASDPVSRKTDRRHLPSPATQAVLGALVALLLLLAALAARHL